MVFGQYEYVTIGINKLVVLPQVRKIINSRIDEMADSIEDRGLINPLDVVRLSYEELNSHINFLNHLWKKNASIDSFEPVGDYYYVVIAGHSRLEALKKNAKTNNRNDDEVVVKVHQVKTSEEILAIQLDENIHTEPRIEERAKAIIETYRLGIINGKWKGKSEFIKQNKHKFNRNVLAEALLFADLPLGVQEYIFSGNIPYAVGVELGRIFPLVKKYEASFGAEEEVLDKNINQRYAILAIELQGTDSVKKGLQLISGYVRTFEDHFRPKEVVQQEMFDWWAETSVSNLDIHIRELQNEHKKAVKGLKGLPVEYLHQVFILDTNLTGVDHSSDINDIKKLYNQYDIEHLSDKPKVLEKDAS